MNNFESTTPDIISTAISAILLVIFFLKLFQIVSLLKEQNAFLKNSLLGNDKKEKDNADFEKLFGKK